MADNKGNRIIRVYDNSYRNQIKRFALDLRKEDFDELFLCYGINPYDVVMESWDMSHERYIILDKEGIVVGAFGVRSLDLINNIGIPWLLGTNGLTKIKGFFVRYSKKMIELLKKNHSFLINWVDANYESSVKWLKWCGFTIEDAQPFGAFNKPFHKFYMECR